MKVITITPLIKKEESNTYALVNSQLLDKVSTKEIEIMLLDPYSGKSKLIKKTNVSKFHKEEKLFNKMHKYEYTIRYYRF